MGEKVVKEGTFALNLVQILHSLENEGPAEDSMLFLQRVDLRCDPYRQTLDLCNHLGGNYSQLLSLLDHCVAIYDHLQESLDECLRIVHLLVANKKADELIWVGMLALFRHRVLVTDLQLPLFF